MKHTKRHQLHPAAPAAEGSTATATRKQEGPISQRCSHIFSVSSTLVGICLIIITSIHVIGQAEKTIIDDLTEMATLFFMTSCLLSFLSIRKPERRSDRLEYIADLVFLAGLSELFITTILLSFNFVK